MNDAVKYLGVAVIAVAAVWFQWAVLSDINAQVQAADQPWLEPNKYQPNWDAERIEIAGSIMGGLLASSRRLEDDFGNPVNDEKQFAVMAINYADALIAELKKRQ